MSKSLLNGGGISSLVAKSEKRAPRLKRALNLQHLLVPSNMQNPVGLLDPVGVPFALAGRRQKI